MYVKLARWENPKKPIEEVRSLTSKRNIKKALWLGLKVVEFRPVSRFIDEPLYDKPRLPGILYHAQRASRHPSGNGLHHYFAELLDLPASAVPEDVDILKTAIGAEALLAAEVRANYLAEIFPDKEISLLDVSSFRNELWVASGLREVPIDNHRLAEVHDLARLRSIPLPDPINV